MLTREADYAVRVILFLAAPDHADGSTAFTIHDELDIPYAFLRNILRRLSVAGIVHSKRGRTGGVTLAKNATKLTILDVLGAIDAERTRLNLCLWKSDTAKRLRSCPVQDLFIKAQSKMDEILSQVTIGQLLAQTQDKK